MLTVKTKSSQDIGTVQTGAPACAVGLDATKGPPIYVNVGFARETIPGDDGFVSAKLNIASNTPAEQSAIASDMRGLNSPDSGAVFFRMRLYCVRVGADADQGFRTPGDWRVCIEGSKHLGPNGCRFL